MNETRDATIKARDYIKELESYIKDSEHEPSVWVPTWDVEDDRIIKVHEYYVREIFTLKFIYENILKELQKELQLDKYVNGGVNWDGIYDLQKWKDAIEIMRNKRNGL